ncbi:hypothetical protein PHMEG_00014207 [Phytophthora megakarya]|uniref:Uncharacterized protein n=1 Tax=Phytophthora megakarya TaxID=4795 RepID=A0A225W4W4_9STRA|nr:hypothetical protein PHMEG_00014207 [Phytophthora megakarya]
MISCSYTDKVARFGLYRIKLDVGKSKTYATRGPSSVDRNVAVVFRNVPFKGLRIIMTEQSSTTIPLAQQLRSMGLVDQCQLPRVWQMC